MRITTTTTPLLGFNSYDCWGPYMNEDRALANLEAFAAKLHPHGYEYFCFDAGWFLDGDYRASLADPAAFSRAKNLDGFGRLLPSAVKFPHGLKPITARCHELGCKFGLHFMRGVPRLALERNCPVKGTPYTVRDIADCDDDCAWGPENVGVDPDRPGGQAYYDSVIELLSEQGVDFVKVDDMAEHPREIRAVSEAIARLEHPMILSLSPGDNVFRRDFPFIRRHANMLRITGDVWDRAWDLQKAFDRWEQWEDLGSPECWLDLDMIPFGLLQAYIPADLPKDHVPHDLNEKRLSRLTTVEKRTFMTQRAMAASPLFFGGELTQTPAADLELAVHPGMLACNRNGIVGKRIYGERCIDIRRTPCADDPEHGWVGVFNRKGVPYRFRIPASALEVPAALRRDLRDLWTGRPLIEHDGVLDFELAAWECFFARF